MRFKETSLRLWAVLFLQLCIVLNLSAQKIETDSTAVFLPDAIAATGKASLFSEALSITHMSDSLRQSYDANYDRSRSATFMKDSTDWSNDALVMHTGSEYDNVAYMKHRYIKFTAFVPSDSVLQEKYDIHSIEDLTNFAKKLYDPVYPDDASVSNPTDRRNSLNRFVSYHLLDREADYYELTCVDGSNSELAKNFNRTKWDIADWYETMMPHSILKCSFPYGSESGLYINRCGVQSRADRYGYQIRGALVTCPVGNATASGTAVNGVFHYIDDVLSFGLNPSDNMNNVQETVFSEAMVVDATTLSPDFMTSGARGHYTRSSIQNGKYGIWDNTSTHTNTSTCLGFQSGSAKNFDFSDDDTHIHVRPRVLSFWSYQGDEVTVKGRYDLSIKLPPLPAGDWEVRLFSVVGFTSRGIVQFYFGNDADADGQVDAWIPQSIPVDMRPSGTSTSVGWKSDADLETNDSILAFDKWFHRTGWMKGLSFYGSASSQSGGGYSTVFRKFSNTLRKVIGIIHSDGKTDNYLRLRQTMESADTELSLDFLEFCPAAIYNHSSIPEYDPSY